MVVSKKSDFKKLQSGNYSTEPLQLFFESSAEPAVQGTPAPRAMVPRLHGDVLEAHMGIQGLSTQSSDQFHNGTSTCRKQHHIVLLFQGNVCFV